jgi:hypothetical protein
VNVLEAGLLIRSLLDADYGLLAIIEQDATGRLAAVRLDLPAALDQLMAGWPRMGRWLRAKWMPIGTPGSEVVGLSRRRRLRTLGGVDAGSAERLRLALDMYRMGEQMHRARLRRGDPDMSAAEIDKAVSEWRRTHPTALAARARALLRHRS